MTSLDDSAFGMGRVMSRTMTVVRNHFLILWFFNLLVYGLPYLAFEMLRFTLGPPPATQADPYAAFTPLALAWSGLGLLFNIAVTAVAGGGLLYGSINALNGQPVQFGAMLSRGASTALPMFGLTFVRTIGMYLGLVFLLVPGVILTLMWSVANPAMVVERQGVVAALRRSRDLTRGHRWSILGVVAAYVIGVWAIDLVALWLSFFLRGSLPAAAASVPEVIMLGLLNSVTRLPFVVGAAVLYFDLRDARDGVGVEALTELFG
jgi:hypothetical protein